jgi:hypothetical protein
LILDNFEGEIHDGSSKVSSLYIIFQGLRPFQ